MKIEYIVTRDETGTLCATVPALPGCFTDGRTPAELAANVREAAMACLESYAALPPGADPDAAFAPAPGAVLRTVSLDFARPAHRPARPARRRAAAMA